MLYARVTNSQVDMARLREQFESVVKSVNPVPCRDNRVDYLGWAITCRDGSVDGGVRRISADNGARKVVYGKGNRRGVTRSPDLQWVYVQDDGMPWRLWLTAHMALVTFKSKVRVRRCPSDALFQWQFPDG